MGGTYEDNYNAKPIRIKSINDDEQLCFTTIKECAEWFQTNKLNNTKIKSIYDSLRKHNVNQKPYMGYYINY
jgi:hypothetical protein